MDFKYVSAINFALRALISLSKFILTLTIASKFSLEVLGEYSLVVNAVLLTTFVIGFEVYQYTSRTIIVEPQDRMEYIEKHFLYILTAFLCISPFFYLFFYFGALNTTHLWPLYVLLFFELVSNEQYRLLIALRHPVFANVVLFIRTSLWIYLFLIFLQLNIDFTSPIGVIIKFWIIGAFLSIIVPFVYFFKVYSKALKKKHYALLGVLELISLWKKCYVLFVASIALMLINIVDKFVINYFCGKTVLGIYVLYFSLTSMIFTFVLAGVIAIAYPRLIELYQKDAGSFRVELALFSKRLLVSSLLMVVVSVVVLLFYLYYNADDMDKLGMIYDNISVYIVLLVSFVIYTLHMKFHYELYAAKADSSIMKSNYVTLIIYASTLIPLTYIFGIVGAASAHLIASIAILLLKKVYVNKLYMNGQ